MRSLIILLLSTVLLAEGSVNVTVDRRRINEGDSIILSVTAENVSGSPNMVLPKMIDFKVISGPNSSSSSSVHFINGKLTKQTTTNLTWTLIPIKTGNLEIPAMSINVGKKIYQSKPIKIVVNKRENETPGNLSKFFLEAIVDNATPFIGEQVTITYKLYTQVDIVSFDEELPQFKGLWTEEIYAPKSLSLREIQKNGVNYHMATIKKLALFPTKSRDILIDPMTAVVGIREKQQRWNDFSMFGPPPKKFTISTNSLKLDVQPLPINKNGHISAVVGNWDINSSISSTKVIQDGALTFQVTISGTGNMQSVDVMEINFPNELEVFESDVKIKKNLFRDKIGGDKQFEWVLIPRFAGDIYIPKIAFTFFDPQIGEWVTKSTPRYRLNVAPNEKAIAPRTGLFKEEIALIDEDIRFLDESNPKWKNHNGGLFSGITLSLLFLSGMVFVFPHVQGLAQHRLSLSSEDRQAQKALGVALGIIESSGTIPEEIYTHIYLAVVSFINHKTGAKKVEYSCSEIMEIMRKNNLEMICSDLEKILIQADAVRFSPISSQDAHGDLIKTRKLLEQANHEWA